MGWFFPLLCLAAFEKERLICLDCGDSFFKPRLPWSSSTKVLLWILFLFLLPPFLGFVAMQTELITEIERFFDIDWFRDFVAQFPGLVLGVILLQGFLLGLFYLMFIPISNARFRAKLEQEQG